MRVDREVGCGSFPCTDVRHECHLVPAIEINPKKVSVIMVSEAAPAEAGDYYYAGGDALFEKTTVQVFQEAGQQVSSMNDIVKLGVYLTTAVKCGKTGNAVSSATIERCSRLLEREIELFPGAKILMLMGDVAIKAVNAIARRNGEERVIPAGPTYKIRKGKYFWRGMRVFPSYLQAGPSFFIEKGKHRVIAEDIAAAMQIAK